MARLFIFGNGYDIAHNIKDNNGKPLTEYAAFKRWLISNIIKQKEPTFNEDKIDLSGLFDGVDSNPNELILKTWYGLDDKKAKSLSKPETDAAQFACAKEIVWLFKKIEAYIAGNDTWGDFENSLGKLEEPIIELITETGIENNGLFSIEKVDRSIEELSVLWNKWIKSIHLPTTLDKNDYDKYVVGDVNPEDIVISTNYTETFELLFGETCKIFHIHGSRRNPNDLLIMGHGNTKYADNGRCHDDISPKGIAYTVENILYKPVSKIINDNRQIFTDIKDTFSKHDNNSIYSFGFSFSDVDKDYVMYLRDNLINDTKITWYLSNYDKLTETNQIKTRGETYKAYLEKLGFAVEYSDY